jgi:glycosyltransferase involved in cell wall biosynthesis
MPHSQAPPLLVTFASQHDPRDVREWSGSIYHVMRALRRQNVHLDMLGNLERHRVLLHAVLNRMLGAAQGGHNPLTDASRSPAMARRFARRIEGHLERIRPDVLFSPSSIPIALVRTEVPKVFYTDATFAGLIDTYSDGRRFPAGYLEAGHALEAEAIRSCDLVIYASEWAARSAIEDYGADPAKVKVVPFGANLDIEPDLAMVEDDIARRPQHRLELLFLGVAWERKGGPKALEVARLLHARGIDVRLRIVGCDPGVKEPPSFVEVIPFIAKTTNAGQQALYEIIRTSHFLVLPTIAECFGIVFAEASAFGVPSITHSVGGVPTAVQEGRNGHLFDRHAPAEELAARIAALFADRKAYEALARSSFHAYRERLNWNVNGALLSTHLRSLKRGSLVPLHGAMHVEAMSVPRTA